MIWTEQKLKSNANIRAVYFVEVESQGIQAIEPLASIGTGQLHVVDNLYHLRVQQDYWFRSQFNLIS